MMLLWEALAVVRPRAAAFSQEANVNGEHAMAEREAEETRGVKWYQRAECGIPRDLERDVSGCSDNNNKFAAAVTTDLVERC